MIYKSDEKISNVQKKRNQRFKYTLESTVINLLQCVNERGINAIHHNV